MLWSSIKLTSSLLCYTVYCIECSRRLNHPLLRRVPRAALLKSSKCATQHILAFLHVVLSLPIPSKRIPLHTRCRPRAAHQNGIASNCSPQSPSRRLFLPVCPSTIRIGWLTAGSESDVSAAELWTSSRSKPLHQAIMASVTVAVTSSTEATA